MHPREFNVDTITARRAPSSPQAVVQTLFHNLLFLFFFSSLFAKLIYYFRSTTFDLLPLGYYSFSSESSNRRQLLKHDPSRDLLELPDSTHAKGYSNPSQVGVLIRATVYRSQSSGSFVIDV